MFNQFKKEIKMNKLFKTLSLIAVFVVFASVFSVQAQQSSAAPANLPYGLSLQDTMADVERKLGQPLIASAPQAGWEAGLPEESGSPDHQTFWAIYRRFGLTIVYNTVSASDKGASINAIYLHD